MTDEEMQFLPRKLREVYALWRACDDLHARYSRPTFYWHRKALLAHGIDIAHRQPHEVVTQRQYAMGRPLRDFLAGGGLESRGWIAHKSRRIAVMPDEQAQAAEQAMSPERRRWLAFVRAAKSDLDALVHAGLRRLGAHDRIVLASDETRDLGALIAICEHGSVLCERLSSSLSD